MGEGSGPDGGFDLSLYAFMPRATADESRHLSTEQPHEASDTERWPVRSIRRLDSAHH